MDINYVEFEKYLEARHNKKVFIDCDNTITKEDVAKIRLLMKDYPTTEVLSCIKSTSSGIINEKFLIETECSLCNNTTYEKISKTKLSAYLKDTKYVCEKCKQEELEKRKEKSIQTQVDSTLQYIDTYLTPTNTWKDGVKTYDKINRLQSFSVDRSVISDYIKSMDYYDFLKTPYWKAITEKKRKQAGFKCQMCGNGGMLSVHHRTYDIHGSELYNMNDLIVLCDSCHKKFHNIKK